MLVGAMAGAGVEFQGSDRFVLVRQLGEGGMGIVYEAIDRARGLHVALKTLRAAAPEMLPRLKNEFRALHELHHPNLVTLGELVEEHGRWFFTMELVDGFDVVSWVRGGGAGGFDEARLRHALPQLVGALEVLHRAGRVHRDIKPSNVLVTAAGRVVLLDFGLTTRVATDDALTDGSIVGTIDYMAPEQATGAAVSPAADWYGLGVILYEALTGRLPFAGTPPEILRAKQSDDPPAPSTLVPGVPSDLETLCRALMARDPDARPDGRVLSRLFRTAEPARDEEILPVEPPFVGRRDELAQLAQALADAQSEGAVTVFVHGESGMGKSALVARFVRSLEETRRDVLILQGRCYEREQVPFKGFDGIVDALTRHLAQLSAADVEALLPVGIDALVGVFPVLARVPSVARRVAEADEDARRRRERAFTALRELIGRLARRAPVVMVLEDFQWADDDSLALRRELMRGRDLPGRLLLATLRSSDGTRDFLRKAILSVDDEPGDVRSLAVAPLSDDESRQLVAEIAGPSPAHPLDTAALVREGRGHPLFLTQLLHRVVEGDGEAAADLPATLWSRVRVLPDDARRLMEVVSVAAAALPQAVAARAAGLDAAQLARAEGPLRAGHLVRTSGSGLDDAIEPYHDQIRSAVLDHLPLETQRAHHRALAEALDRARPDAHALYVHWLGAGEGERAAAAAAAAAEHADAIMAFDRAAQLWAHVIELRPSDAARRTLWPRLGAALDHAGRPREAIEAYRAAAQLADGDARLEHLRRAAELLLRVGEVDLGLALLGEVLAAIGMRYPSSPRRARLALLYGRTRVRLRGLRFTDRGLLALPPRTRLRIDTAIGAAQTLSMVDHVRGADFQTRGLLLALSAGEPYRIGRAIALEAGYSCAIGTGSVARTRELLARSRQLARLTGHPHLAALTSGIEGIAAAMEGRFRTAAVRLSDGEALLAARPGAQFELATVQFFHVMTLSLLGRLRELGERVRLLRREAAERGDLYTLVNLSNGYAHLDWLREGDAAGAREQATASMRAWSQRGFFTQHFYALLAQVNLDLYAGDGETAYGRVMEAWAPLEDCLLLHVQFIRITALDLRARAALSAARTSRTPAPLRASAARDARLLEREGAAWATALAALVRAQLGQVADDFARAAVALDDVDLGLHAAVARYRAGLDDPWFAAEGVADRLALARCFAPGAGSEA